MINIKLPAAVLVLFILGLSFSWGQSENPVSHWSFDQIEENRVPELLGGLDDELKGNFRQVRGVKGQALVLDGYTTCLVRSAKLAPALEQNFTLTAWIALGAYPWNWAPIAAQENTVSMNSNQDSVCWPDDIVVNSPKNGFFFGVSPEGYLGLHIGAGGWQVCRTENKLPLRTWTHVAAVFRQGEGITLYIDGEEAGNMEISSPFRQAGEENLRIGRGRQKLEPSHPVRAFATLASWFALDGILDELFIYSEALGSETIRTFFQNSRPDAKPELPSRQMPS